MPLAPLSVFSPMAGFPNVHSAYYFSFSVQFPYPSHPLISVSQINFHQMWVSELLQDLLLSLHDPNLLWAICVISLTSLVFPTHPKLVSSATFLHMLFSLLYRSLIKKVKQDQTNTTLYSKWQRGGRGWRAPCEPALAQEGCNVMQQHSARRLPPLAHSHLSPLFVYDFSARFQVLRVWSYPSQHTLLCQVTLTSSRKTHKNLFAALDSA